MINTGKCPHCETIVRHVTIEDIDVHVGFTPSWRGISYVCPSCKKIIGISIDPIALKSDIIDGVAAKLRGK